MVFSKYFFGLKNFKNSKISMRKIQKISKMSILLPFKLSFSLTSYTILFIYLRIFVLLYLRFEITPQISRFVYCLPSVIIINLFTNFIINQGLILIHLWYYCLELHLSIITQRKPSKFLIILNNLRTYLKLSNKVIIILRQGYISTTIKAFLTKTLFHLVNDLLFS